ncbi:hypothetical protein EDB85DRAFT_2281016 [Lactarius pseudohatsudake]|nr:hypothetical protein EDB85DRAFT_2281016 [Lactarius pseudohatsudake]
MYQFWHLESSPGGHSIKPGRVAAKFHDGPQLALSGVSHDLIHVDTPKESFSSATAQSSKRNEEKYIGGPASLHSLARSNLRVQKGSELFCRLTAAAAPSWRLPASALLLLTGSGLVLTWVLGGHALCACTRENSMSDNMPTCSALGSGPPLGIAIESSISTGKVCQCRWRFSGGVPGSSMCAKSHFMAASKSPLTVARNADRHRTSVKPITSSHASATWLNSGNLPGAPVKCEDGDVKLEVVTGAGDPFRDGQCRGAKGVHKCVRQSREGYTEREDARRGRERIGFESLRRHAKGWALDEQGNSKVRREGSRVGPHTKRGKAVKCGEPLQRYFVTSHIPVIMGVPDMPCGVRMKDRKTKDTTERYDQNPRGATQKPGIIHGPARDNPRRRSTRKVHGNREDTGNPAAAATTSTQGDTHGRDSSGGRPKSPTSTAQRIRSGWHGSPDLTSGYLPGLLGRVLGG